MQTEPRRVYRRFPFRRKGARGYWSDRIELFDEVRRWIRSEAVKAKMTKVAGDYPRYDFVEARTHRCRESPRDNLHLTP